MRIRLILSFIFIVLVSILSTVLIARGSTANEVRTFMLRGGMTGTENLVKALEDYYANHQTWRGADDLLSSPGHGGRSPGRGQGMMGGMINQRLRLANDNGTVLLDTAAEDIGQRLSADELARAVPLYQQGQIVGYLLPEGGVAFAPEVQSNLLSRLNRAALTAGLFAGALALILAFLLAYRLLRPIRELTHGAQNLAEGNLDSRVPVRGDDELAVLGKTFNQMAASLQRAEKSRRSMTADIAHELRTPLAVQRAHLEALQDGVYEMTPENLDPILEQNHMLTRLVDDLRTLALAEAGQLELERVPTDLKDLVRQTAERFKPAAAARSIEITTDLETSCPLTSVDPLRVGQILGNLLTNALRHTPEGGKVSILLGCNSDSSAISVQDSGPGIPPEALSQVFERFYRADRSRSRSEGGTGLGLAIARQLAVAHSGSLTAANHSEGGAVFTLTLPRDKKAQRYLSPAESEQQNA